MMWATSLSRCLVALATVATIFACGGDDDETATSAEIRIEQVEVGDLTFDIRVAGPDSGETVVLLHGFPETSYQWRAQLLALARAGYRAIAPDQRGYSPGARPGNVEDYSILFIIQDALAIADAYGAESFHLVGHDWGAGVAWGIAGLAPDRIDTLTVLSIPHPDPFAEDFSDETTCQYQASSYFDLFVSDVAADIFLGEDAAALRALYASIDEDAVDEYLRVLTSAGAMQAALNWYKANFGARAPTIPELGVVSVPTLFVWSDGDDFICRETAERSGDFVDAPYEFVVLEGVDHWISERAPNEVNRLLLRHIGS